MHSSQLQQYVHIAVARHCGPLLFFTIFLLGFLPLLVAHLSSTPSAPIPSKPSPIQRIGDTTDNLFWFIQITDIHLSKFEPERTMRFRKFCNSTLPSISPSFVITSGDLVHAQTHAWHAAQNEEEWKTYRDILVENKLFNASFWIDMRGNHDAYNVPSYAHKLNYFKDYSVAGSQGLQPSSSTTFQFTHNKSFGKYQFVFMDITQMPGVGYPMNFFGTLTKDTLQEVELLLREHDKYNSTMLVSHYPLMMFDGDTITSVANSMNAPFHSFLCGHTHMYGMYSRRFLDHSNKYYLELELGDFKSNDYYRIAAFDHDVFSFIDVTQQQWPQILLTNPKDSRFLSPEEPWNLVQTSSHIRALVFPSPSSSVKEVSVSIDGSTPVQMDSVAQGHPLFVRVWNPQEYASGIHWITVTASDEAGNENIITLPFSVDGTVAPIGMRLIQFIQHFDFEVFGTASATIFYLLVFVFLLVIPKMWTAYLRYTGRYLKWESYVLRLLSVEDGLLPYPTLSTYSQFAEEFNQNLLEDVTNQNSFSLSTTPSNSGSFPRLRYVMAYATWYLNTTMWQYSQIPMKYWIPLVVCGVYLPVGPYVIGTLIDSQYWGAFFIYGVLIEGILEHALTSTLLLVAIMAGVYLPLICFISLPHSHEMEMPSSGDTSECTHPKVRSKRGVALVLLILLVTTLMCTLIASEYGVLTLLLSPGIFWVSVLACFMIFSVIRGHAHRTQAPTCCENTELKTL